MTVFMSERFTEKQRCRQTQFEFSGTAVCADRFYIAIPLALYHVYSELGVRMHGIYTVFARLTVLKKADGAGG